MTDPFATRMKFIPALHIILVSQVKKLPANAGDARDLSLTPGLGRSPGVGYGNPLHYSGLENSVDRGACWATVHRVIKSQIY